MWADNRWVGVQVGAVVRPVQRGSRRRVSFEALSLCVSSDPGIYQIVTRYPHDIPQGTAIPRWAFFNVTVRDIPTSPSAEAGGLTCCTLTPRVYRVKPSTILWLWPSVVSLILRPTPQRISNVVVG